MRAPESLDITNLKELPDRLFQTIDTLSCSAETKELLQKMLFLSEACEKEVAGLVPVRTGLEVFRNIQHLRPLLDLMAPNFGFCVWAFRDKLAYVGLTLHPDRHHETVTKNAPTGWTLDRSSVMAMFERTHVVARTF